VTAAEGQGTARTRPRPRLLGGDRDFRLLWSASAVSQLGTQVSELAIPLAAIVALHAGPAEVGTLAALGYLPAAVFGLYAGAWADRLSRRRIMMTADIARCAVLATVPVAYLLGVLAIGQLYAVAFCVGGLSVFFDTASPAYLPALVPRPDLAHANSRLQISEQGAAVLGPGLAGWLVGLVGAPLAVAADAASYLASAIFLCRIGHREPSRLHQADGKSGIHTQIRDGIRHVAASRQLRAIAIAAAIINLFGRMMVILVPLYLIRDARYSAVAIGLVFALGSIGFLIGAAIADKIARRIGLGRAIVLGGTIAATALLLIAAPPATLAGPATAAAMFLYGTGALVFTVSNITLRQLVTPPDLLGRVTSSMRLLTWIAQPAAGLLAAWLGTRIGLHDALWVGALGALSAPIPLLTGSLTRAATGQSPPPNPAAQSVPHQ
jgi:MFS family permease